MSQREPCWLQASMDMLGGIAPQAAMLVETAAVDEGLAAAGWAAAAAADSGGAVEAESAAAAMEVAMMAAGQRTRHSHPQHANRMVQRPIR